jgi:hypothetical protein
MDVDLDDLVERVAHFLLESLLGCQYWCP